MTEEHNSMVSALSDKKPMLSDHAPPWIMEVFYEKATYRVRVHHDTDPTIFCETTVHCHWEPIFGIDVQDKQDVLEAAEAVTAYLESTM